MMKRSGKRRGRRLWEAIPRPRAGRRLPAELRPRRVGSLARGLEGGLTGPGFETLLRRIDEGPVHGNNAVRVFTRGEDTFEAMRAAIASARDEILIESYIWRDDAVGRPMMEELGRAVERGVTVRAVADAFGSVGTGEEFWDEMERLGIRVRLFNPFWAKLFSQHYRDHRKILVVDREVVFTGGMNLGAEHSGKHAVDPGSVREAEWRDTHLEARGPVAWEMAVVFAENWERAGGERFEIERLQPGTGSGDGARAMVLDARPGRGHEQVASVLAALVGGAAERVWITNAYFAPRPPVVEILGRAVARGVDVRLLLPGRTDMELVRHAGHGFFAALLARGVRIWEYRPAILHAKTLVADGVASVVGSTNLDFRSFHFNAECNLVVLERGTGRRVEEAFEEDLEWAEEIRAREWAGRGWWHGFGDRMARKLSPWL